MLPHARCILAIPAIQFRLVHLRIRRWRMHDGDISALWSDMLDEQSKQVHRRKTHKKGSRDIRHIYMLVSCGGWPIHRILSHSGTHLHRAC